MPTNNNKKQKASSSVSPISSQETSVGKDVPANGVNGDNLLLRLAALARDLYGQSQGVVERLCQTIVDESQGQVRLVLLRYQYQPAGITSSTDHPWIFQPVECAGRSYGKLEVAPHPTLPGQPALLYQHIQLLASTCAFLLYSLETAAYFRRECPQPVKLLEDLTDREQEILELMCRGYQRKQIAAMLDIEKGTIDKMCQNIYTKMGGKRTERHAVAAAFLLGLFPPIENLSSTVKSSSANGIHPST